MSTDGMPVLVARGIQHSVRLPGGRRVAILRGLDLTVSAGETVAIVGRSGSGKSTLLSILGLLTHAEAGELSVVGQPVGRLDDRRRAALRNAELGFVFQSYSLVQHLTARKNVELALRYGRATSRRGRDERVRQCLSSVGLQERARSRPRQLSGGEQQRVAIARALVRRPAIILADEPTGALDVETAASVLDVLEAAARDRGTALVVVTHDLAVAARMDRTLELRDGTLHPISTPSSGGESP